MSVELHCAHAAPQAACVPRAATDLQEEAISYRLPAGTAGTVLRLYGHK